MNCIIVEDEPFARKLLAEYIRKVPNLMLVQAFGNPMEALAFVKTTPVDILFLDVQMPELTGISFLKVLKQKPIVILTTAYSEYAIEGYELDVTDYLLKPITFERFVKAIEKATQRLTEKNIPQETSNTPPDFIFVKDGRQLVKVKLSDIKYIEGLKDYVRIHTPTRKIMTIQRLKAMEEMLPSSAFIRVHHSYIVALEWIEVVSRDKIQIGQDLIPVSDSYRKVFQAFIKEHEFKG